tara:strand:- start:264 stop:497 length:234 start_codon:yes stop_codon:yes gene_type:complete
MKMKLFKKGDKYGIMNGNGQAFVMPIYEEAKHAIMEWRYYEVANTKRLPYRKVLPWLRTMEDIDRIEEELIESSKTI